MAEAKLRAVTGAAAAGKTAAAQACLEGSSSDDLIKLIELCANEQTPIQDAKLVLTAIAKSKLENLTMNQVEQLDKTALEKLESRKQFFKNEEADFRRQLVNSVYDVRDDFYEAVLALEKIEYEGDMYEEKIDDWLNIAAYQFELHDPTAAEQKIKKVMYILHKSVDQNKVGRCKIAHAKVQDSNRDFLNAAQNYISASTLPIYENDLEQVSALIDCAIKVSILSPAGPKKNRLIAILHGDERAKSNVFYDLLAKMFLGAVIRPEHVTDFKNSLEGWQNVVTGDGYSVLEKALIEHNILVISRIYMNIRFDEVGKFLGISADQAEDLIATMVEQGRIQATLDQENELVEFQEEGRQQQTFNDQIRETCEQVDTLCKDIVRRYPALNQHNKFVF